MNNCLLSSWKLSFKNLFKVQRYLYKSVFVRDMAKALLFQKLILMSNSTRLLSIREVTQLSFKKNIAGVDGVICSSFLERFKLNENLKINVANWFPNIVKKVIILKKDGESFYLEVPTIMDRCWQTLVQFCLEPAHEAIFNLRSLGFRPFISIEKIYKVFYYNLNIDSFGIQKRLFSLDVGNCFRSFKFYYLLKKIILPRSMKLGIFRCLNLGLKLGFPSFDSRFYDLTSVLSNIVLDGVESIHSSVRFGHFIIFFLKPSDNEANLLLKVNSFLDQSGLNFNLLKSQLISSLVGFNFLYWNFKVLSSGRFVCLPSYSSYQKFLLRIKHIINNSNYGAVRFCSI
jgi:hypothetical protein